MKEIIVEEKLLGNVYAQEVRGEIVRCKDCRWGEPYKNVYGEDRIACENDHMYIDRDITVPADWYCADGKRR